MRSDDQVESHQVPFQLKHLRGRLMRRAKYALGHEPAFLPILLRVTPLGTSRQITNATDLVVEGFPRSGNTFTTFAIEDACEHELTIASHVHLPSQIKRALARSLPTLLVIRDPVSALASYLVYDQRFPASTVIREYCSYHRELVPYAERLLICEFDEVTTHMGAVIDRINHKFSLRIPPFNEEPSNVKRLMTEIEWTHKLVHPHLDPVQSTASPQEDRRTANEQMREALLHPRNAAELAKAQDLFGYFCNIASRQREMLSRTDRVENQFSKRSIKPSPLISVEEGS
jgi:hypothetical protein